MFLLINMLLQIPRSKSTSSFSATRLCLDNELHLVSGSFARSLNAEPHHFMMQDRSHTVRFAITGIDTEYQREIVSASKSCSGFIHVCHAEYLKLDYFRCECFRIKQDDLSCVSKSRDGEQFDVLSHRPFDHASVEARLVADEEDMWAFLQHEGVAILKRV